MYEECENRNICVWRKTPKEKRLLVWALDRTETWVGLNLYTIWKIWSMTRDKNRSVSWENWQTEGEKKKPKKPGRAWLIESQFLTKTVWNICHSHIKSIILGFFYPSVSLTCSHSSSEISVSHSNKHSWVAITQSEMIMSWSVSSFIINGVRRT